MVEIQIYIRWYYFKIKSFGVKASKIIVEFFLCLFLLLLNKKYLKDSEQEIYSVIIPLMHGLGDAVIFNTCLYELNYIFPKARITYITTNRTFQLFSNNFRDVELLKISKIKELISYKKHYDLMIFPSRNIDHYLIALLLKPKSIIGYNFNMKIYKHEAHIQRAVRILTRLDWHQWKAPYLYASNDEIFLSEKIIRNHWSLMPNLIITIIIGGRWCSKTYKLDYYRILIKKILEKHNVHIILIGKGVLFKNDLLVQSKYILNLVDKTNINELKGIISHSNIIIGPDGGVLNIAMAMRKSIVGIFSSVDPSTIISDSYKDMILYEKKCRFQPCYNEEHEPFCPYTNPICIDIKPDIVYKRVQEQIESIVNETN